MATDISLFLDEDLVEAILLIFMTVTAFGVALSRSLFASIMLMGIFSLLSAALFVSLDAVDVAFTEAVVGAGISVVLFLGALSLCPGSDRTSLARPGRALAICALTGAVLIVGTLDMPEYGDPDAPIHRHVGDRYLSEGVKQTGVPNIVTVVLADYRGFDTLGETTVVFTAAAAVISLLGTGIAVARRRKPKARDEIADQGADRGGAA